MICGQKTDNPYPLCEICESDIQDIEFPYCRVCGKPLPSSHIGICGGCIKRHPPFEIARSGYLYEGILKEVIHKWKYNRKRSFSRFVNSLILRAILKSDIPLGSIDMVTYVPIPKRKLRKRGFNQTEDMANYLSLKLNIPIYRGLKKKPDVEDQVLLTKEERLKNVKGAFYLSESLPTNVRHLLIIDDVYTTGATVKEVSKVFLSKRDRLKIYVFTLARGIQ